MFVMELQTSADELVTAVTGHAALAEPHFLL